MNKLVLTEKSFCHEEFVSRAFDREVKRLWFTHPLTLPVNPPTSADSDISLFVCVCVGCTTVSSRIARSDVQ